jgi:uncharacterized protein (DUF2267 family)
MVTRTEDELEVIATTVQKTYRWIRELDDELDGVGRREAYQVLRGFLHVLRDRLIVDEAAQLGAQLPMLVRGIYYEGWDPSKAPRKMRADEFLALFFIEAAMDSTQDPLPALRAAARVMRRHVTAGETTDVFAILPQEIRELLG